MRRPRSKSLLKRIVEKALPNAIVRRDSPEYPSANILKLIDDKHHDPAPQDAILPYYAPHTITLKSHPDLHTRQTYHSDADVRPPRYHRADALSIQTNYTCHDSPKDTCQAKRFNLDNFIQRIESWTPPSPREVLARRLFREVQRASTTCPRAVSNKPLAGGYLVHRRIKGDCAF